MLHATACALGLVLLLMLVPLATRDAYPHPADSGFSGGAFAGTSLNNLVLTGMFGAVFGILALAVFRNNNTMPARGNVSMKTTSKKRIILVVGIAVAGLSATLFALVSIDWSPSARIEPAVAAEQKQLLEMAREIPEVKSFLQKHPDAKQELVNSGYSYAPMRSPLSIDDAQIKYSSGQYYRDHSQGKFYADNGFQQEDIVYLHLTRTADSISITTASGVLPMHQFQGYYYAIEPQCIITKIGKEPIPGFPSETSMVYLAKECPPIQEPFTAG